MIDRKSEVDRADQPGSQQLNTGRSQVRCAPVFLRRPRRAPMVRYTNAACHASSRLPGLIKRGSCFMRRLVFTLGLAVLALSDAEAQTPKVPGDPAAFYEKE